MLATQLPSMFLHFVTQWPFDLILLADCSFSHFGFIVRTDRQTDRQTDRITDVDDRRIHENTVGIYNASFASLYAITGLCLIQKAETLGISLYHTELSAAVVTWDQTAVPRMESGKSDKKSPVEWRQRPLLLRWVWMSAHLTDRTDVNRLPRRMEWLSVTRWEEYSASGWKVDAGRTYSDIYRSLGQLLAPGKTRALGQLRVSCSCFARCHNNHSKKICFTTYHIKWYINSKKHDNSRQNWIGKSIRNKWNS